MALIESFDTIHQKLDNAKPAIGLFVDLSKAFDSIDHQRLLDKLDRAGVRGALNQLIPSFITGRSQYVEIDATA